MALLIIKKTNNIYWQIIVFVLVIYNTLLSEPLFKQYNTDLWDSYYSFSYQLLIESQSNHHRTQMLFPGLDTTNNRDEIALASNGNSISKISLYAKKQIADRWTGIRIYNISDHVNNDKRIKNENNTKDFTDKEQKYINEEHKTYFSFDYWLAFKKLPLSGISLSFDYRKTNNKTFDTTFNIFSTSLYHKISTARRKKTEYTFAGTLIKKIGNTRFLYLSGALNLARDTSTQSKYTFEPYVLNEILTQNNSGNVNRKYRGILNFGLSKRNKNKYFLMVDVFLDLNVLPNYPINSNGYTNTNTSSGIELLSGFKKNISNLSFYISQNISTEYYRDYNGKTKKQIDGAKIRYNFPLLCELQIKSFLKLYSAINIRGEIFGYKYGYHITKENEEKYHNSGTGVHYRYFQNFSISPLALQFNVHNKLKCMMAPTFSNTGAFIAKIEFRILFN